MALDGGFLYRIAKEISDTAIGGRVEKIHQPSREEIVISIRCKGGAVKLLASANAGNPRIHITESQIDNPQTPPMFCMLLRKKLTGARLSAIRQNGLDRTLYLDFDGYDDLGDPALFTLVCEIMGRHSNIILFYQNNKIIDAIKRVTAETSSVRQVLPGIIYSAPPAQDKLDPLSVSFEELSSVLAKLPEDTELSSALLSSLQGISPVVARELAYKCGAEFVRDLNQYTLFLLQKAVGSLVSSLNNTSSPVMLLNSDGVPKDFSFVDIDQYGEAMSKKYYPSCCALLDSFYRERGACDRMRQRTHELQKHISNLISRLNRKLEIQKKELDDTKNRDSLKIFGDILSANLYSLSKGMTSAKLFDFYSNEEVVIPLNPTLSPQQNAQKYYSDYKKACAAEKILTELISSGETEIRYIESILDLISRASTDSEISAIRDELSSQGYLKTKKSTNKKPEKLPPLKYISSDGFTILSGRNNLQNDRLSLKDSRPDDIWLHTKSVHGSHTLILRGDAPSIPDRTIEQAAIIAAYNSKARDSVNVQVDFTLAKYVKKIPGAKPGMVSYTNYSTAVVSPDSDLVASLASK